MNQMSLTTPTLEILYDKSRDFKIAVRMQKPDGTLYDFSEVIPVMEINSVSGLIMNISGADIEKTLNSEIIFKKAKSFFETLDCMLDYKYKIYDQPTGQPLLIGPFKIAS